MVKNLAKPENFGRELKANLTMEEVEASEVEDFASVKSLRFFKAFNLLIDFLSLPQTMWMSSDGYIEGKKKEQLGLNNDTAVRGVALIQEYIHVLTKDKTQRQCLFQVVAGHRKNFIDATKKTVIAGLTRSN